MGLSFKSSSNTLFVFVHLFLAGKTHRQTTFHFYDQVHNYILNHNDDPKFIGLVIELKFSPIL